MANVQRVLVVGDVDETRQLVSALAKDFFHVHPAKSAVDAKARLESVSPGFFIAIFVDWELGAESALPLCQYAAMPRPNTEGGSKKAIVCHRIVIGGPSVLPRCVTRTIAARLLARDFADLVQRIRAEAQDPDVGTKMRE